MTYIYATARSWPESAEHHHQSLVVYRCVRNAHLTGINPLIPYNVPVFMQGQRSFLPFKQLLGVTRPTLIIQRELAPAKCVDMAGNFRGHGIANTAPLCVLLITTSKVHIRIMGIRITCVGQPRHVVSSTTSCSNTVMAVCKQCLVEAHTDTPELPTRR